MDDDPPEESLARFGVNPDEASSESAAAQRERSFNGLTAAEWTERSRSVWRGLSSARQEYHKEHGATFPESLARRLVEIYSGEGDLVFDPFVGTGTTVIAAMKAKRRALGIELVEEFADVGREQLAQSSLSRFTDGEEYDQRIVQDDCRNLDQYLDPESVQVTVTSPPYANLIHLAREDRDDRSYSIIDAENNSTSSAYSDAENDLGNMEYDEYLDSVGEVMEKLYEATTPGGYNVWVVKDFRDVDGGRPYVPLHSDVAEAGQDAGFDYHDLIVWDQNQHRRLVLNGYPSVFYANLNSSFVVVLRRPE
ncbi:MAG: DNA methyltransferase [Haloferacaceae archaeon]